MKMAEHQTGLYLSHPRALSTAFVTALAQPRTPRDFGVLPRYWKEDPLQYQNAIVVYHPIRDVIRRADRPDISVAHQELYDHKHDVFRGAAAVSGYQYKDAQYGGLATPGTPVIFRESIGPEPETVNLQIFPNAEAMRSLPVVISLRRPEDFITSHLTLWPDDKIESLKKSYLNLIKIYENIAEAGGNVLLITTDHIRKNPRATMQKVTDHLEIPFHEGMLSWARTKGRETVTFYNNPFIYLYDESYPDQSSVRVKPWFDSVNGSRGLDPKITTIITRKASEDSSPSKITRSIGAMTKRYKQYLPIANNDLFAISSP